MSGCGSKFILGQNLFGMTKSELLSALLDVGITVEKYRADQLFQYLYTNPKLDSMFTLPKSVRERIKDSSLIIYPGRIKTTQISTDGTRKYLISGQSGVEYETVLIPSSDDSRRTLCVSSQVGCSFDCTFCHTGTQSLQRNLTAAEILGQYLLVQRDIGSYKPISNVVFMGQGEPLLNLRNVGKAINILKEAYELANQKITVSTSGVAKAIPRVANLRARLAVSLHAPNDELRWRLMPSTRHQGTIEELMAACHEYSITTCGSNRRVTFEYVLLKDQNDSIKEADQLGRLLRKSPFKTHLNLLPFHQWPGSPYEPSGNMHAFKEYLINKYKLPCTLRPTRGADIMAACGQLKSSQ